MSPDNPEMVVYPEMVKESLVQDEALQVPVDPVVPEV